LTAAAREWPVGLTATDPRAAAFVAHQPVLRALFDGVQLLDVDALPAASGQAHAHSAAPYAPATGGSLDVVLAVPLATTGSRALRLAGTMSLRSVNFLSSAGRPEGLGAAQLQTIVADQQGRVLAHSDPSKVSGRIDGDPRLRKTLRRWRNQGSPLEPAPWTEQVDGNFIAMAAVPGTDWMVFRLAPAEALFEPASRSIARIAMTGLVTGLVCAIAIFAATAWFLRPMSRLQRRALLALDPDQPAQEGWPGGDGEVAELSNVLRHVSQQLATSRGEMEHTLRQMQAVLDHAPTGIAFTIDGRFALVSREFERMLGYDRGELEGDSWERLLLPSTDPLREATHSAFCDGYGIEPELQLRCRDGSLVWAWMQGAIVQGRDSSQHKIWIVGDATDARRRREQLQWSATHDPLTDLVNRREFEHQLRKVVAERRGQPPACALFIDLDHFKQVNDSAGHGAGDEVLKRVAQALQRRVRGEDTVARLGGDEFAVLLRGCGLDQAAQIAEQVRHEVQARGDVTGAPRGVTASIGVVEIAGTYPTPAAVLEAADQACYAAKHAGRNVVRTVPTDSLPGLVERRAA
jgi:diguanylate cyclase (GGDEF)-like protein/PAS domain S-box-containing protein